MASRNIILVGMLCAALCSCKDEETVRKLEESEQARTQALSEVDKVSTELSKLKQRLLEENAKSAEQNSRVDSLESEKAQAEKLLQIEQEEKEKEKEKAEQLRREFEQYKLDYAARARKKHLGQELTKITDVTKSRTYQDVTIFFYRWEVQNSRVIEVCRAYEKGTASAVAWYDKQLSTRGDAMRLGERVRLPDIRDGLSALGIKED